MPEYSPPSPVVRRLRPTVLAAMLVAASATASFAQGSAYPLTIHNCGQTLTFDAPPQSAITVGQAATEILYALGLAERIAGTSVWFSPVLEEFREVDAHVERLADNDPSFESIVNKSPGLVAAQYEWHVGPAGIVATREQFHELGIPTYVLPSDCDTKDNTTGGDGTRTAPFDTASIYRAIRELAAIFDARDAGDRLVSRLRAREQAAIARARSLDLPKDMSAVFWFSSAEIRSDPFVAGRKGSPGYMMDKLGIANVVQSDEEWPAVGWETIARANPAVIVVAEMDRRRFPADDVSKKLEFLRTDPVASQMDAVRNNRIVVIDAHAMDATIRTILGLEKLAAALAGLDFGA